MFVFCFSCESETKQIRLTGAIFGTTYSIIYQGNESYNENFLKIFKSINNSLSTYIPSSIISNINKNKSDSINEHIKTGCDECFFPTLAHTLINHHYLNEKKRIKFEVL